MTDSSFSTQMDTLAARSDASMCLGPAPWMEQDNFCFKGPLSEKDLRSFFVEGFFTLPLFSREELQPVIEAIEEQVDQLADRLYQAGKIKDKAEGVGFYQRMHKIEQQYPGANVCLHKHGVLPEAIQRLWSDKRLVDIAQQLLGGSQVDVAGHPVWNLRVKVPNANAAVVPWHQDAAYLDPEATHTLQVTAWIPLIDAKVANGCMQMIHGGHRSGNVSKHTCCAGGTWYVEMDLDAAEKTLGLDCKDESNWVTCEMPMGHVLFLNNLIPHRSLPNVSNDTRWSLDLRWQDASLPAGFWGIKEAIVMRKADDPAYRPEWGRWAAENRNKTQAEAVVGKDGASAGSSSNVEGKSDQLSAATTASGESEEWDLVPVIAGPWMHRWPLVHHNTHTEYYISKESESAGRGGDAGGATTWHKA